MEQEQEQQRLLVVEPHELSFKDVRLQKVRRAAKHKQQQRLRRDSARPHNTNRQLHRPRSTACGRSCTSTQPPALLVTPQAYTQTVRLTNTARAPLECEIRAGSSDRYSVVPSSFRLRPGEGADVSVTLKVLRFGQRAKAVEQGQRDWFTVKLSNFPNQDQRFHSTFYLDASEAGADNSSMRRSPARSPRISATPARGASPIISRSATMQAEAAGTDDAAASSPQRPQLRRASSCQEAVIVPMSSPMQQHAHHHQQQRRASTGTGDGAFSTAAAAAAAGPGSTSPMQRVRKSVSFAGATEAHPVSSAQVLQQQQRADSPARRATDGDAEVGSMQAQSSADTGAAAAANSGGDNPFFKWGDTFLARRQQLARARSGVTGGPRGEAMPQVGGAEPGSAAQDAPLPPPQQQQQHEQFGSGDGDAAAAAAPAAAYERTASPITAAAAAAAAPALNSLQERLEADRKEIEKRLMAVAPHRPLSSLVASPEPQQLAQQTAAAGEAADDYRHHHQQQSIADAAGEMESGLSAAAHSEFAAGSSTADLLDECRSTAFTTAAATAAAVAEAAAPLPAGATDAIARAVQAALTQEQARQEERNRRALELLLQKDDAIRGLEHTCHTLREQLEQVGARTADAEASAAHLESLLQQEMGLRQAAEARAAAAAAAADALGRRQRGTGAGRVTTSPSPGNDEEHDDDDGRDALLREQAKQLLRMQQQVGELAEQLQAAQRRVAELEGAEQAARAAAADNQGAEDGAPRPSAAPLPDASLALRLQQLEEQNASLTRLVQLAEGDARAAIERAAAEAGREAGRLRQALAERDAEVASLAAELAVVRAAVEAGGTGEGGGLALFVCLCACGERGGG